MLRDVMLVGAGAVALALGGCSSDAAEAPTGDPPAALARAGEIRGRDTWKNGVTLTGTVSIAPGAVVEIAPGATIKCADGAAILVGGELRARAADKPAKITCESWNGILVANGGKLDFEGVTLENAKAGITTTEGALESRFVSGAITSSLHPLQVAKKSVLVIEKVKASAPAKVTAAEVSMSEIRGSLKASHLDYDAGANEALSVKDGGELVLEDSIIHGTGGGDMVAAYDAKSIAVRYTTLKGAHCGPHIQGVDSLEIDHVTSEDNIYGITMYKTGAGPNVIKDSNINGGAAWLDFQGDHGPVTMQNVYASGGNEILKGGPAPTITKATAPIANARPRD